MEYRLKRILAAAVASLLIASVGGVDLSDALIGQAAAQEKGAVPGRSLGTLSDSDLWRAMRGGIQGTVTIPDKKAGVVVQSEGENWRNVRNGPLSVYGGWMLGGTIALLAVFFAIRGRIGVERGMSGRTVERFNDVERFTHWLTATSFIVLGLTGLNILYGRYVILPVIGPEAFSTLTEAGKYAHNFVAFAFIIGIVMMIVLWVRQNIPDRHDLIWLAKGGGILVKGVHVPAKKFNAGQKIIFWLVIITGISISFSGLMLMFPFMLAPFGPTFAMLNIFGFGLPTDLSVIQEMQLTQLWHALLGLLMIALIFAHVYIGTLGMVGAFDSMGSGQVDVNWAREHHDLWAEELGLDAGPASQRDSGDD